MNISENSLKTLENKLVFYINLFLITLIIFFFYFDWDISLFFYTNLIITFILGYLFFRTSKPLAKTLILTNLFIFFYFLYPNVAEFLTLLFGSESYIFILFYTVFIAYMFIFFSKRHKTFVGPIRKTNLKIAGISLLSGLAFGILFYLIKEPVPALFANMIQQGTMVDFIFFIIFTSLVVAIAEQMVFCGFLFNSYNDLTSKWNAFVQVALVFIAFHLLRFEILVNHHISYHGSMFAFYIGAYYILLFLFMISALYLYSFKWKKEEGNFIYPVLLHFGADVALFGLYLFPFVML